MNVVQIKDEAFKDCTVLTSVMIPNHVTSIGSSAFSPCSSLTSVTIGNGVTSIGDYAFRGCSGLKDVYCHAVNVPTAYYAFYDTPLSSATLHVPAASIDNYRNTYPWRQFGTIEALEE